ncbi:hypothetical protein NON08_09470 [Cetobacterium somerae]|uniref:hypothetical protein n=1 Tax=Cetobacterium sp. NK01 TaxID=2993530 RepID=UPI002115D5B2|nr:hypothetical protein [Cetobacterium sp. NK01]MCQ8212746.1 hypothetical protein [Cetobacterium sp. NK01]
MKKVLLGLLALSATLMAVPSTPIGPSQSTGTPRASGENQIDITTKAFIVDSGLIITERPEGVTAIKSIELDHGTIMKGSTSPSKVSRSVYIKRANDNNFPDNTMLKISLTSPHNNLTHSDNNVRMAHTLTGRVFNAASATSKGLTLSLAGNKNTHTNIFSTNKNIKHIQVDLNSKIEATEFQQANLDEGSYSNTSTLSVKFSKNPALVVDKATSK